MMGAASRRRPGAAVPAARRPNPGAADRSFTAGGGEVDVCEVQRAGPRRQVLPGMRRPARPGEEVLHRLRERDRHREILRELRHPRPGFWRPGRIEQLFADQARHGRENLWRFRKQRVTSPARMEAEILALEEEWAHAAIATCRREVLATVAAAWSDRRGLHVTSCVCDGAC